MKVKELMTKSEYQYEMERLCLLSALQLRNNVKWDCSIHNISYEEVIELTTDGVHITYIFGGKEKGTVCTVYYENGTQYERDFRDCVYSSFIKDLPTLKKLSPRNQR